MPGCIDSFSPELTGWFFLAEPGASSRQTPTLLLTLNGQTLLAFQPRLRRGDVDKAHGRSCGAVGFCLPVANLLERYGREARAASLPLELEVVCPSHPQEPINNARFRLGTPLLPANLAASFDSIAPSPANNLGLKSKCAHFYSVNFFDPGGNTVYSGGAERYITDLAALLQESYGLMPVVYQASHYAWERSYQGLQVIGVPCLDWSYRSISRVFQRTPAAAVHLYSPVGLACAGAHHPAIGISHGAYWDTKSTALSRHDSIRADLLDGLEQVDQFVSVDANSLASLQAHRGLIPLEQLGRIDAKTSIVLNYAAASFAAAPERSFQFSANNPCRLLYARRLYAARGFDLVVKAAAEIFRLCPHLVLTFCGGAEPEAREPQLALQQRFPGRVSQRELLPEQMPQAYRDQHISLVPTINSEGSSLSALESMASGCVVIASYTGGLANIVVDGFNGILIPPTVEALVAAITDLYQQPQRCVNLSKHGRQVATSLNLQSWRQRWRQCLERLNPPPRPYQQAEPGVQLQRQSARQPTASVLHPLVEGVGLGESTPGQLPLQRPQALFELLERMGIPTRFCAADRLLNSGERICSRQYTCYDDICVVYVYKPLLYAFLIPELQHQLPETFKEHSDLIGQRLYGLNTPGYSAWHYLQEQVDRIRSGRILVWFDWLDAPELEWPELPANAAKQQRQEQALLSRYVDTVYEHFMRAATIFTTSNPTLQRRAESLLQRQPTLIPNATVSRYSLALKGNGALPEEANAVLQTTEQYRWRLVYWGTADPRVFDVNLIAALAVQCPAAAVLLVGTGPWPRSRLPNNVFALPQMKQPQLWQLAQHCQAGLLPFLDNTITAAVDPLKLHEYLEAGLPVLATDTTNWREIRKQYGWAVPLRLCNGLEDWLAALNDTLNANQDATPSPARGRLWSDSAPQLLSLLQQASPELGRPNSSQRCLRLDPQGLVITSDRPSGISQGPRNAPSCTISEAIHGNISSQLDLILNQQRSPLPASEQWLQLELPLYVWDRYHHTLTLSTLVSGSTLQQVKLFDSAGQQKPPSWQRENQLGATVTAWNHCDLVQQALQVRLRLKPAPQHRGQIRLRIAASALETADIT